MHFWQEGGASVLTGGQALRRSVPLRAEGEVSTEVHETEGFLIGSHKPNRLVILRAGHQKQVSTLGQHILREAVARVLFAQLDSNQFATDVLGVLHV